MKEGSYIIHTNNYKFEMNIYYTNNIYTIEYGDPRNKEGACVGLTYFKNSDFIKLDYLSYFKRCSKDNDLLKGTGTQELLQSILKICIDNFNIKKVIFNDVSNFECDSEVILLSMYYLLLYGETWYENKFSAKYSSKIIRDSLKLFKLFLKEKPSKGHFSFYDSDIIADTWKEYFIKYKDKYTCLFIKNNLKEIEKKSGIVFKYAELYIKNKNIKKYNINYTIKKQKTGGTFIMKPDSMCFSEDT